MAKPASGKPSLIDLSPSSGGAAGAEEHSIRMLDGLEPGTRSMQGSASRRGFRWTLASLLVLVAGGTTWTWWGPGSHADDRIDRLALVTGPVTLQVGKTVPTAASAAVPATAASAAAEPATSAAIIATPESTPASAALAAEAGASPAASVAASAASSAARLATPAKPEKTQQSTSTPPRDTRVASPSSNTERKRVTTTTAKSATTTTSSDPDVALLSAMLATMSGEARPNSNASPYAQTRLTIAQLVERCSTQGVKNSIETFACKRRICEGYWGKADACPMALSPKKTQRGGPTH